MHGDDLAPLNSRTSTDRVSLGHDRTINHIKIALFKVVHANDVNHFYQNYIILRIISWTYQPIHQCDCWIKSWQTYINLIPCPISLKNMGHAFWLINIVFQHSQLYENSISVFSKWYFEEIIKCCAILLAETKASLFDCKYFHHPHSFCQFCYKNILKGTVSSVPQGGTITWLSCAMINSRNIVIELT